MNGTILTISRHDTLRPIDRHVVWAFANGVRDTKYQERCSNLHIKHTPIKYTNLLYTKSESQMYIV